MKNKETGGFLLPPGADVEQIMKALNEVAPGQYEDNDAGLGFTGIGKKEQGKMNNATNEIIYWIAKAAKDGRLDHVLTYADKLDNPKAYRFGRALISTHLIDDIRKVPDHYLNLPAGSISIVAMPD